jgi:tRNA-specific 2-thiouridylase
MSGGMDSTAAALILKKERHDVVGFHMSLHGSSDLAWKKARQAAAEIDVPILLKDFRREFDDMVVSYFLHEYLAGRTPSPCPVCNKRIKMTRLSEAAAKSGCERLATGHYARVEQGPGGPRLLKGLDKDKDQSYFLCRLTRAMLGRTIFPLGKLTKQAVKEMLRSEGSSVWQAEESQELCFVPGNDYRRFLRKKGIRSEPGPILDLQGNTLGTHEGIVNYTVGQRRGLGICGPRPLYVVRIDVDANAVYVGTKDATYVTSVKLAQVNYLTDNRPLQGDALRIKVRSTAGEVGCVVSSVSGEGLTVTFDKPQSGVAPGQAGVLYSGDRVVGGGWIEEDESASHRA